MADFNIAYEPTSKNEGGYANVSGDTGGETYAGISRKWFPKWDGWAIVDKNKPLRHNQIIKDDKLKSMVKSFYKKEFWDKVWGDRINNQDVANRTYDFAVNAGVGASIKNIQKSLNYANPNTNMSEQLLKDINDPIKQLLT